jgi:hypothetical protein
MATRSKRIKMAASQPDPFTAVHFDIRDLVIQHFKVEDIKELTTVSKGWNQIIGGSSAAMKRIMLNVWDSSSEQPSRPEVTALLKSNRKYQNLDLHLKFAANIKRKLMLLPKFSSSLVELDLRDDNKQLQKYLPEKLSFPKLKALWIGSNSVDFITMILKHENKLQKLSTSAWMHNEIDMKFAEVLLTIKSLKKLDLYNIPGDVFSLDSFRKPEFKLNSLTVSCKRLDPVLHRNFKAFVLSMADTLTSFDINLFRGEEALLIQELPSLKTLRIGQDEIERPLEIYKPNTSIEVIHLMSINSAPSKFFKSLTAVRSLRVLCFVRKNDFKKILRCFPGLLQLEVCFFAIRMDQKEFEDIYKEVRTVEPSNVESLEVKQGKKIPFVLKL